MKFAASIVFTLGCVIACNQSFAAKVYKWTDDKGVVHFSAQPPLNTQTQVIKPQISKGTPTGESAASEEPVSEASGKSSVAASAPAQLAPTKDPARCEVARKNEQSLKTYNRIKVQGEDGEFRFLSEEEKQQKMDEANAAIQESCE
ncbi:MAG: DUF4124 domain-containing protein [Proteobacteria bacterium]|nr:MAG: DUF4124 domain-containing protein [Pseudomonadota bacterium]